MRIMRLGKWLGEGTVFNTARDSQERECCMLQWRERDGGRGELLCNSQPRFFFIFFFCLFLSSSFWVGMCLRTLKETISIVSWVFVFVYLSYICLSISKAMQHLFSNLSIYLCANLWTGLYTYTLRIAFFFLFCIFISLFTYLFLLASFCDIYSTLFLAAIFILCFPPREMTKEYENAPLLLSCFTEQYKLDKQE